MSSSSELVTPFLGALQASIAVLLTVFSGVIAAQYNLLDKSSAKHISKFCVQIALPALLIHNVGSELHLDTGVKYVPILLWAIVYNAISMATGVLITKIFKLPNWVSPAVAFNNTTSLPLLLIQSLETTGVLDTLLQSPDDTASKVVKRAQSYFLINAIVSNTLTFGMGPKLLNGFDEEGPEDDKDKSAEDGENGEANGNTNGNANGNGEEADEQTSLLPRNVRHHARRVGTKANDTGAKAWEACNPKVQAVLSFCWEFLNAPLIGAVIGAIVGLTPGLHRAFFNDTQEGGFFNAWLTSAIKNVGDLFAALQVVVVGVKLSQSMRSMKQGKESGHVPWPTFAFISFVRYVFWPLISIPLIWVLAAKTNALPSDPVLWFTMMLMPAGPPAMKLTALADVNGSPEEEKMSIAKFLTLSYIISPLICFPVVGSLKAAKAAAGQ